jgi:hypothetical protein
MNSVTRPYRLLPASLLVAFLTTASAAPPQSESLHARIDRMLDSGLDHPVAATATATDADYLRRITLDLTGMPPSVEELNAFLADQTTDKREKTVDRLLESPLFSRHLATTIDIMLMERRPTTSVSESDWQAYLLQACRENRPLNEVFRAILKADGNEAATRPAVRFYLDRGSDPNLITRDVGRIVFGRDMQCAQCHNHRLISDYQQSDYHGLLAFFATSAPVTLKEGKQEKVVFAENAGKDLTFDSVFVKNDKHMTGPRLPGEPALTEPVFPAGDEYQVKPADKVMPVPRFVRRVQLADHVASGKNEAFNENIANRLWAMMMGRGLVHPVDLHHPENPPSHPELMKMLATELVGMKFNAKAFLREIALTKAYGRSLDFIQVDPSVASRVALRITDVTQRIEVLNATADRAKDSYDNAVKAWYTAETVMIAAVAPIDTALAKHAEATKARDAEAKAFAVAQALLATRRETAKALTEAASKAEEVVKRLPAEKEIATAAQKFVDRSKLIATEIIGLDKALKDKEVVVKKANDALIPLAKSVDDARAKAAPLRETVWQKEQATLAARRGLSEARVAVEHEKRRLESLQVLASYLTLDARSAALKNAIDTKRASLLKADAEIKSASGRMMEVEKTVKTAEATRLTAEKTLTDLNMILDLHQKKRLGVTKAVEAAEAAQQLLAGDPAVGDALQKLKAKAEQLRLQSADPRSKRDLAQTEVKQAVDNVALSQRRLDDTRRELAQRGTAIKAMRSALVDDEAQAKAIATELATAIEALSTQWSNEFRMAQLKPLSPEQFGWSIMKVSNIYDNYWAQEEAELNKSTPLNDKARSDPAQRKARRDQIEQRVFDKLKGALPAFVKAYAAGAGQPQNDFFATVDQALFVSNGDTVNGWIKPMGSNIAARMIAEKDPAKATIDLYRTILTRTPTAEESADVVRMLNEQASNKPAAVQEILWGLLMSTEFRFNH